MGGGNASGVQWLHSDHSLEGEDCEVRNLQYVIADFPIYRADVAAAVLHIGANYGEESISLSHDA